MTIYDAAMRYQQEGVPLVVIAGKEYGAGSSRDWAAKGTLLLGVRAVIAESYERIHRSNLVGMGVLPLEFKPGETAESLGLTGHESSPSTASASWRRERNCACMPATIRARKKSSKRWPARTRPRKWPTTAMAESCRTCCGRCSRGA